MKVVQEVQHILREASMERAIDKYYVSLDLRDYFLTSAAVLFYKVIQDGNGRLSRLLLLAYALARAGFPFAVPLT